MARRGLLLGVRLSSGVVAVGVAAVTVAAVGLIPLPTVGAAPVPVRVEPAPAGQVRVCSGAAVRLGDAAGGDVDQPFVIGSPTRVVGSEGADLDVTGLSSAAGDVPAAAVPVALRAPAGDTAVLGGTQVQSVQAPDFSGLTASACSEPSSSAWLVGGATSVGRTSTLLLANPDAVDARVDLQIWGEDGPVASPGLSGIEVPAGGQVALALAGFAPGLTSPVVRVSARGGLVAAALQHSVVRGLDAVGVETVAPSADPAPSVVIPGVRVVDSVGVNRTLALDGWEDVAPIVRVGVPGDTDAQVTLRVAPVSGEGEGTTLQVEVAAGTVGEFPLDPNSGGGVAEDGSGETGLVDGVYTVFVDADVPVVAAARVSTAVDSGTGEAAPDAALQAPASDLAWFPSARALSAPEVLAIPDGPAPLVALVNTGDAALDVEIEPLDGAGESSRFAVPAGDAVSLSLAAGSYLLRGDPGLRVGVCFAGPGALAAFALAPPRPVAGTIDVHPR